MDTKRTRRFLIVAFALSLLIHLIASGVIRWPFQPTEEDVQIVHIEHVHATRIAHVTPPPHTPPPRRVPVRVAKATANNPKSNRSEEKVVIGAATPEPSAAPTPTPSPNCTANDTPVELAASPSPPAEIPPDARASRANGVARVQVAVDPSGNVSSATVVQSSGNASLDLVAVSMARAAQYAPATHACKAIASNYTFAVQFNPF